MARMALIDHYDSFTFNVIEWLKGGDSSVQVDYYACDDEARLSTLRRKPLPLVLSPGPKRPEDAPASLAIAESFLGKVPILGICLGHQMLGCLAGGGVVRSQMPFHGTTRQIQVAKAAGMFVGLPSPFRAAVYHSLVVAPAGIGPPWSIDAVDELGEVQALRREVAGEAPAYGVQFHPESYLSEQGELLRRNWLAHCR